MDRFTADDKFYLDLITSEHASRPNYNAYVALMLRMLTPLADIFLSFDTIFNLDNAVGDQLDKLGALVALSRQLPLDDSNIPQILDDTDFRRIIKARILTNFWDGTIQGWYDIVHQVFPDAAVELVDGQDMTMSVVILSPDSSPAVEALLINGYLLPKPAGVAVNYSIIETVLFGWDSDTQLVKGWDEGTWRNT